MVNDRMKGLEPFGAELDQQLGDNLVAFCVFGPAVRHDVDEPDLSTLLVVKDASPKALRPIEQAVRNWTKKGNPPPLIFAEAGWRASTDVFPIEIEDMREAHIVIRGVSPFDGVRTTRTDLRRELEREVRGKLLRLRTELVAAAADPKALEGLLLSSAGTFFVLFRAVLRLADLKPPQEREPLVWETAATAGMDADAFPWILDRLGGRPCRNLEAHDAVGDVYLEQIERLARFVDTFDSAVPGEEN